MPPARDGVRKRSVFINWREKFGRVYIETIKYPTDENEPWWDVFCVVEALPKPRCEIPFDHDAPFGGDPADLDEFHAEMWFGSNKSEAHRLKAVALVTGCKPCSGQRPARWVPHQAGFKK
jgi:hypothetical protein